MKKFITMIMVLGMLLCCSVVAYADTGAAPDILNDINALNMTLVLGVLGVLAFAVELIVELTKELPGIKKIPTKLYAIIVSLIICVLALFIYSSYASITVLWYYIALAIFMGFVVAYISMYGWETLKDLYSRYKK